MKLKHVLSEMPMKGISHHEHETSSFSDGDKRLLKHFIAKKTYEQKMVGLKNDLYIYLVDHGDLAAIGKLMPEGAVEKIDGVYRITSGNLRGDATQSESDVFLQMGHFSPIFKKIEERLRSEPDSVHFIMGDNYSEDGQIGPTPWILTHRFVHAFQTKYLRGELTSKFSAVVKQTANAVKERGQAIILPSPTNWIASALTMKSARNKTIPNPGELQTEMATQYLLRGEIQLDEAGFTRAGSDPQLLEFPGRGTRDRVFSKDEIKKLFKELRSIVDAFEVTLDHAFEKIKGQIFYV